MIKQELEQAVAASAQELFGAPVDVELTRPDEQFGDYASNVALQLAKQVGKSPREIAEALQDKLAHDPRLRTVDVAAPGFLNLRLSDEALVSSLQDDAKPLAGKKVLVEYSDPNPFKPLHAGHLYTTLVGDTIARLIEHAGAETIRINYGGDVGLHVGKSMWAILRKLNGENPEKLDEIPALERPTWLGERYVEGNNAYEANEVAKAEIIETNKRVYMLHESDDHESAFAQIYYTTRQWSYDYFAVLYQQLEVVPFDRYIPESEVTPLGIQTVREHTHGAPQNITGQDVFFFSNEGNDSGQTVIFPGENFSLHTRVFINREGIPTYETKDVGLSLTKWQDYHFDESIIITANEQAQYMQVILAALGQFEPDPADRTRHLTHGVVKLQGGVKMSSRKGNVVTALEILDAAHEAGRESGLTPSEETILAAVKYALAKNRIGGDIVYDPKESIALEGNSGPYLQYAHARARSILSKAVPSSADLQDLTEDERNLLRKISEYGEVVARATSELMPHYICTYLYELAQKFNQFYEHNRVIGDEREAVRLVLVRNYADILKRGLNLLGITAPDRM